MLILILIGLTISSGVSAQRISLNERDASLTKIIKLIEQQSDYIFLFEKKLLNNAPSVTIDVKEADIREVLDLCFKGQSLHYIISGKTIGITSRDTKKANSKKSEAPVNTNDELIQLNGKVTDLEGHPLVGVSVVAKGTLYGVTTDSEGKFSFDNPIYPKATFIFSHIGYKTDEVQLNGRKMLIVTLEPQEGNLDEVVISTGYQKIEKKYLTGAVTSLKMDSIKQPGLSTVDKMLEGRVPGLIYMQNSGQPGAAPKLRIRGTSTLLGSQEPLWVVDGIVQTDPIPVSADKINNLDFVNLVGNAISGLNPNDIEQIDVLKDAAATALYGVRAANGVIVVTTKRGKPGPPTVTYQVTGVYTRRPRYTDKSIYVMNSRERVAVSRELIEKQIPSNSGNFEGYEKAIIDYYNGVIDYDTYRQKVTQAETLNTDWFKAITRDVFSTNHTLGISGGSQASRYYASIGYNNEQGAINGEYNKRYTALVKFDVNYKNFKGQFDVITNKNDRRYNNSDLRALTYAYSTSRAIPLYNADGSLYYFSTPVSYPRRTFNILNEMSKSGNTVEGNTYQATANLNYQVIPGLQLSSVLSYNSSDAEQRSWFEENTTLALLARGGAGIYYPDGSINLQYDQMPFGGQLQSETSKKSGYTIRGQADLVRFLDKNSKHQLSATLGSELSSTKFGSLAQRLRGYYPDRGESFADIYIPGYPGYANWLGNDYNIGGGKALITDGLTNLASVYATASYIINDTYIISANTRSDFSNAFGNRSNNRFLPTWSLSGRWNIHNDILEKVQWVNMAALRFSYGSQGNMLPFQTPYTILNKSGFDGLYRSFTSFISAFPNPNLKWEKTDSYNAGLDFSLFNNRINGTISYFYKRTKNAFLSKKVSSINGFTQYTVNAGILDNRGLELAFNFTPVNQSGHNGKKGFIWRIDPQLGQVFNRLLDNALNSNNQNVLVDLNNVNYYDFLNGTVPVNGKSVNTFFAYRFKELDQNGQPVFYGAEPENAAKLTEEYRNMTKEEIFRRLLVEAGRREPVIQGGISNYFGFGNWSLNFMFTYSLGNKIRLLRIASGTYGSYRPSSQQNLRGELVNRWQYPGDELYTNIPAVQQEFNVPWYQQANLPTTFALDYYQMYDDSDIRIVSGNYLKLQSLNLAYNCDPEICKRLGIKSATLSLGGSNLFTLADKALHGQDPSQSGTTSDISLSIRPVYTFGINISF